MTSFNKTNNKIDWVSTTSDLGETFVKTSIYVVYTSIH